MKECLKKNKLLLVVTVLFSVITSVGNAVVAIFLQKIIDVTMGKDFNGFLNVLLATLAYIALYGMCYFIYAVTSKMLVRNLTRMLRKKVFRGVLRRGYQDFTSVNTADYISALTNDVKLVEENYILPLLLMLQHAITFVATLVLLLILSPVVTGCLVLCMILMYTIPSLFGKALQSRQDALSGKLARFTTRLKDIFSGYEVIKSYRVTSKVEEEFRQENHEVADAKYAADKLFVINESLSQMLAIITQVVAIFVSAYLVLRGSISMGTLIALVQLGGSFVWPIVTLMQNLPKVKSIKPVLARLDEFSDYSDSSFTGTETPSFRSELKAKSLAFSYDPEHPVLSGAELTLRKGKKYAVVGESGCGKTTLIKLLSGCYAGYEGEIWLDDRELRTLDIERVREMISIIHQNVYMFDKSIEENICIYQSFPKEKLDQALRLSGVDRFLSQTTDGLASPVGENGANLSGGQRQRIAIARALVQRTPILILDEGTSAIDMQTAYDIESRLLKIPELTLLTVTHKMSGELLGKYDEIIFMKDGIVAEMGNLEELLRRKAEFATFYSLNV